MKKSTVFYLIAFLILVGVAVFFQMKKRSSTIPQSLQDFSVEDTSQIVKVILSDKNNNTSSLERKGTGTWMVNGKYKAERNQVELLLETVKLVRVKSPVSMAMRDRVVSNLATTAVTVKIFDRSGNMKKYYVGSTTPDELGTLMLLDGSSEPFVTHIPGFEGYLTTRYLTNEKDWRTTEIYTLDPSTITDVQIEYPSGKDASFKLTVDGDKFYLKGASDLNPVEISSMTAKRYLAGFKKVHYENILPVSEETVDSILATSPVAVITVNTNSKNNTPVLRLYQKPIDVRTKGVGTGGIDLDKFYATMDDNKEILLVQMFAVGKLVPSYQELKSAK